MNYTRIILLIALVVAAFATVACANPKTAASVPATPAQSRAPQKNPPPPADKNLRVMYVAGGCFWGVEEFFQRIPGVTDAVSGYANGKFANPTYKQVSHENSGHAETVQVIYDPKKVSYEQLLHRFFQIIDPTSLNRQGNDVGVNYRTGIYYISPEQQKIAEKVVAEEQKKYKKKITVEVVPLNGFYKAEEYHQDYLRKNPNGYCHIDLSQAEKPLPN